jgi:hypothetical protein
MYIINLAVLAREIILYYSPITSCWIRHTQGHSLSVNSNGFNTKHIILDADTPLRGIASTNDKTIDDVWCCGLPIYTLWHSRYASSDTRSRQYKGKTPLLCNSSLMVSACCKSTFLSRQTTNLNSTHYSSISYRATPESDSMSDTVHTPTINLTATNYWSTLNNHQSF